MSRYIVVFGGCGLDCSYKQKADLTYSDVADIELPGGKGANQAVAASRAGYNVKMITIVGNDDVGEKIVRNLAKNGVDISNVKVLDGVKSDSCKIYVSVNGDNEIIRSTDAIKKFSKDMVDEYADVLKNAEFVITQSKMPKEVYFYLIDFCYKNGVKTVLTPCPAKDLKISEGNNRELLRKVNFITANEEEAKEITETENISDAVNVLRNLVATAGANGVYYYENGRVRNVPSLKPKEIVDTTGAGDTFCGNFVVALLRGFCYEDSIKRGVKASTIKLEKMGAQPGMPYEEELTR